MNASTPHTGIYAYKINVDFFSPNGCLLRFYTIIYGGINMTVNFLFNLHVMEIP